MAPISIYVVLNKWLTKLSVSSGDGSSSFIRQLQWNESVHVKDLPVFPHCWLSLTFSTSPLPPQNFVPSFPGIPNIFLAIFLWNSSPWSLISLNFDKDDSWFYSSQVCYVLKTGSELSSFRLSLSKARLYEAAFIWLTRCWACFCLPSCHSLPFIHSPHLEQEYMF